MARIEMHISKAKLPFYPPCEVKCRLQNGVSIWTPRNLSGKISSPGSESLVPLSGTTVFSLIANPSEDIAVIWELCIDILLQHTPKGMDKP